MNKGDIDNVFLLPVAKPIANGRKDPAVKVIIIVSIFYYVDSVVADVEWWFSSLSATNNPLTLCSETQTKLVRFIGDVRKLNPDSTTTFF